MLELNCALQYYINYWMFYLIVLSFLIRFKVTRITGFKEHAVLCEIVTPKASTKKEVRFLKLIRNNYIFLNPCKQLYYGNINIFNYEISVYILAHFLKIF